MQGNPYASSLGDSRGALESYRSAEAILRHLSGKKDKAVSLEVLSAVYKLAGLEHEMGMPGGAQEFERARVLARQLISDQPRNVVGLGLAANIHADLARIAADARSPQQSLDYAKEAVSIAQRLVDLNPNAPDSPGYMAVAQNALATAYRFSSELNLAAQTFRTALVTYERLVREYPEKDHVSPDASPHLRRSGRCVGSARG